MALSASHRALLSGFKYLVFEVRLANMPNSSFRHTLMPRTYLWYVTASPAWMRLPEKFEGYDPPIKVCQGPCHKNRSNALILRQQRPSPQAEMSTRSTNTCQTCCLLPGLALSWEGGHRWQG